MENEQKTRGRPTAFKPEFIELGYKFALLGADDTRIAELLGIGRRSLYYLQDNHPELRESIQSGKAVADAQVAESLFKRACGYKTIETRKIKKSASDKEASQIEIIEREVPPDTTAARYWLNNRTRKNTGIERWADRHEVQHSGTIEQKTTYKLDNLTDAEKEALLNKVGFYDEEN